MVIHPAIEIMDSIGDGFGLFYNPSCTLCRAFIHQHFDLRVKTKYAGKKEFVLAWEMENLVSSQFKEILESAGLEGADYRPVYSSKGELIWYQLVPRNILPPAHPSNDFIIAARHNAGDNGKCRTCGFISYHPRKDLPPYYSSSILETAKDFNRSFKYFGMGAFPRPWTIVSQKVRQLFLKHKAKSARFEPVFLIEDSGLSGSME